VGQSNQVLRRDAGLIWAIPVHVSARSVPRNPPQRMFVHEEGFGRGLPASRSVARETVHPIPLGQAPLLDYDHQLISLATG
jgi:hypothetical protein